MKENLKNKKIAVIGGAGFIGSHIVEALVKIGSKVIVIDDLSTGNIDNINEVKDVIEFVRQSVVDTDKLADLLTGVDMVCHQAALPSVPKSINLPMETNAANLTGTLSMFTAAVKAKVPRVVYASSSSVYGNTPVLPKVETMPANPLSPYAAQKFGGEIYAKIFHSLYGLETIGLRYFNVFGPKQNPNSEYAAVVPKFISSMKRGKRPVIYGDGTQTRDFTFVDNVVAANLAALSSSGGAGEVFNIASGGRISLNELMSKLNSLLAVNIKPEYANPRIGDIKDSYADISKAGKILGYRPEVSFDEGLKKTIEWYS
ncbi:SDR family oxidoreductase [Patescibacteria group bacterium]|nr:SDR family oxidoreductase [Patescibacteria group bacterium]MDE1946800.1 SDR family oxidoreductase [Patescibacteria group bacterium]MDE2011138.1 SDR family oxidoreductase [Patescibacteria group bacterium]MDE2233047.1 SDR family oxidoreductase [Patescibacteria group bacterium]